MLGSPSRTRTGTPLRAEDFKSSASAVPPRGQHGSVQPTRRGCKPAGDRGAFRLLLFPAAALVLLFVGCSEPRAVPIIGPDGSHMFHVSCGDREAECYRLAGERCPYGYDVGRTVAGAGNMLVRCRAPMLEPAYPTAQYRPSPPPLATRVAPAQPPESPPPLMPAPAQPAPAAPQPAPTASSAIPPASAVPYAPRAPVVPERVPGRVDLGY